MNKSLPIFKILAIICLSIVGIIEITILVDNAEEYSRLAKFCDAEYMSMIFYITGFLFIGLTASTLFSFGKRNFGVVGAAAVFLILIGTGYFLREHFEPDPDISKIPYLFLLNIAIFAEKYTACLLISAAALVLGILDMSTVNTPSYSYSPATCAYCGRQLIPGERCNCDLNNIYASADPEQSRASYTDNTPRSYCSFCGKYLHGTQVCNCPESIKYEETVMRYDTAEYAAYSTPIYNPSPVDSSNNDSTPQRNGFANPHSSSMPLPSDPPPSPNKAGDSRYFNKPKDL